MPPSPNVLRTESFCPRASQGIRMPGNTFRDPRVQGSTSQTLMSQGPPGHLLKCRFRLGRSGLESGNLHFQKATKHCRGCLTLGMVRTWSTALAGSALFYLPRQALVQHIIPKRTARMQISRGSSHSLPPQTWNYSTHCKFHHRPFGASRPFQGRVYPRVRTPALLSVSPHAAPLPWPQKALTGKVKSTQQAASLPRLPGLLGILGKEGREGERRISREQGGPVRSCDRLGLLVPPRWQCQHAVLKYLAGLRSKHPI